MYLQVISTRQMETEDGTLYLDMKCGNLMQQRISRIQTDHQAVEIARLIKQYITIGQFYITKHDNLKRFAGVGFSNIPGKYENVVFIIKNPRNMKNSKYYEILTIYECVEKSDSGFSKQKAKMINPQSLSLSGVTQFPLNFEFSRGAGPPPGIPRGGKRTTAPLGTPR